MKEAGLIKRWKEVFWPNNDECDLKGLGGANVIMVYMADMQGVFYILGMGKHMTLRQGDSPALRPGGNSSVGVRFVLTKWANGSFLFDYMGQWELLI